MEEKERKDEEQLAEELAKGDQSPSDEVDAAKLSDEAAQAAARAFLGTAEPEEEVSVDEAKNFIRRAGTVAEAEPEAAVEPAVQPEPEITQIAPAPAEVGADGRRWYVIHTYSGYENKVKTNLEHRIQSMDMGDKIFQVLVPTEEEIEIKNGKRHPVEKRCSRAMCSSR